MDEWQENGELENKNGNKEFRKTDGKNKVNKNEISGVKANEGKIAEIKQQYNNFEESTVKTYWLITINCIQNISKKSRLWVKWVEIGGARNIDEI